MFILAMSAMVPGLIWLSAAMWMMTLISIARSACSAPLRPGTPMWCRGLVVVLHLFQPPVRAWHRYAYRMRNKAPRTPSRFDAVRASRFTRSAVSVIDGCWISESGHGREMLLKELESIAQEAQLRGILDHAWESWDMSLFINRWCNVRISTATEELGNSKRFTRVRCIGALTTSARVILGVALIWSTVALISQNLPALGAGLVAMAAIGLRFCSAMRQACVAAAALADRAASAAGLHRYAIVPRKPRHSLRREARRQTDVQSSEMLDRIDELGADIA
jgi:hypothetical protein